MKRRNLKAKGSSPLSGDIFFINRTFLKKIKNYKKWSPNVGLEPTTLRLRVSCSTDWASRALEIENTGCFERF